MNLETAIDPQIPQIDADGSKQWRERAHRPFGEPGAPSSPLFNLWNLRNLRTELRILR